MLISLILFLPLVFAMHQGFPHADEGGGGERTPQYVEQQVESALSSGADFSGVSFFPVTINPSLGVVDSATVSGTVSVHGGSFSASSVDSMRTNNDVMVGYASNVIVSSDGGVTASTVADFSVCGVTVSGANNLDYGSGTLSFSSAHSLFLDSPFSASEDVGQTSIMFDSCRIVRIETVFNRDVELVFQNHLSSQSSTFLPNNNFADLDGDGLSDSLEETNGLNKNSDDTDNDGVDDYDEMMRYPTDPKKAGTLGMPDKKAVELMDNGSTKDFMFQGNDLVKELNLSKNNLFVDSDRDGISDIKEEALGYDYKNNDMDGDGLNDGFELRHGFNPKEQTNLDSFWKEQCSDCLLKIQGKAGDKVVLEFNDGSFTATLDEGMAVNIGNANKNTIDHTAIQDNAIITHSITENEEIITNNNADTSIHYDHYTDHVRHGTFTIVMGKTTKQIGKVVLDSPGIFFRDVHDNPDFKLANATFTLPHEKYGDLAQYYVVPEYSFASSFALYRPVNLSSYTISFGGWQKDADALVAIENRFIELRGIITYRRMGYHSINAPMNQTFLVTNYTEADSVKEKTGENKQVLAMYPIIPAFQRLTDVLSSYSEDNRFVLSLLNPIQVVVTIESVGQDEHAYDIFFEDIKISGMNTDAGLTERWDWVGEKPNAVQALRHNHLPWRIVDMDNIVTLQYVTGEQHQLISKIDSQKAIFHKFIDPYRIPMCDAWAAAYREQQNTVAEDLPSWALQQLN